MSSTQPRDGGPIYPCNSPIHQGMSLRDWLAGQALAGFTRARDAEMFNEHTTRWYARIAYSLADAMLVERDERRDHAAESQIEPLAPIRTPLSEMARAAAWPVAAGAH